MQMQGSSWEGLGNMCMCCGRECRSYSLPGESARQPLVLTGQGLPTPPSCPGIPTSAEQNRPYTYPRQQLNGGALQLR